MNEQSAMMNQQQQQKLMNMNQSLMSMNQLNTLLPQPQPQPQQQVDKFNQNKTFALCSRISRKCNFIDFRSPMAPINRSYGIWSQPQQFQNPNLNPVAMKQPSSAFKKPLGPRNNWKGKRVNKPNDKGRMEQQKSLIGSGGVGGGVNMFSGGTGGGNLNFNNYNPPTLNELQHQNRLKTRKYFPKKKFNKNNSMHTNTSGNNGRFAPYAPRNTTSFLIRAKRSGGIAPLVSPFPVTPAVLPTPILTPSTEVLGDMAKEEWGVDGYGSMKGLIRLRSPGHEMEILEDEEEDEGGSSDSDVEEHVEVERRLDHDLSRFEMIYDPNSVNVSGMEHHNVLENRVDDQDTHIAQLEEENLILKERLFLMERELGDLRRRLLSLERGRNREDINEEVVENESENESESSGEEPHLMDDNNDDSGGENNEVDRCVGEEGKDAHTVDGSGATKTTEKVVKFRVEGELENEANRIINIHNVKCEDGSVGGADDLTEGDKTELRIAKMAEGINNENKYADVKVEATDNFDAGCNKLVDEDDSILEGGVAKDSAIFEEAVAN